MLHFRSVPPSAYIHTAAGETRKISRHIPAAAQKGSCTIFSDVGDRCMVETVRVVVTGGAGFIGANLCAQLVARGADVVVLDDLSTGSLDNLGGLPVDIRIGCVTDEKAVAAAVKGAQAIVHLAAIASVPLSMSDPLRTHLVNVTGTLTVLEAARAENAQVILASSAAVYGDDPSPLKSEALAPRPLSPYAVSKLAAEEYCSAWHECFGLPVLAFRFFNVFGPLQRPDHVYAAVVPAFLAAATAGEPLRIFGDGQQTRDFVPVETVVQVLADSVERRITHRSPVNLAFGGTTTVAQLADAMEVVLQRPLARCYIEPRAGDIKDSRGDDAVLRRLFPRVARPTLSQALRATVAWWQSVNDGEVVAGRR